MRLFGKVDSGIYRHDRAEWMTPPFDLSIRTAASRVLRLATATFTDLTLRTKTHTDLQVAASSHDDLNIADNQVSG